MFHSISSFSMFYFTEPFAAGWRALCMEVRTFDAIRTAVHPNDCCAIGHNHHHQLSEVVVQATRTNAQSPVPHSNFSAEKLAKQYQAQDVPYLLSAVPSLVETSDGGVGTGYTGLRIRGSDPLVPM
jgi:outer membrane cobalamin receptor